MTEEREQIIHEINEIVDLEDDEHIFKVIQRTNHSYFIPVIFRNIIIWIIIVLSQLAQRFIFPSINSIISDIVLIFFFVWLGIFILSIILGKVFVKGHIYVITNKRIIMQRKFLSILFREIEYKRITDLVLRQSLWGRVFNFGVLLPVTAGIEMGLSKLGMFSIEGIKDVFEVRNMILNQIRLNQDQMRQKYLVRKVPTAIQSPKITEDTENSNQVNKSDL